jgi:transcriptional regulator with XRE-family HTH domain
LGEKKQHVSRKAARRPASAGPRPPTPAAHLAEIAPLPDGPDIAGLLRGLRAQSGLSLNEVAEASGLSASFLSAVERSQSDISVQRLARVAAVYNHDLGSLLGYSQRRTTPRAVPQKDRIRVERGEGIDYEALRISGSGLTLFVSTFSPRTKYTSPLTHAGFDVCYVVQGEIVLEFDGVDYTLKTGDCFTWPGSYPHLIRNDSSKRARVVAVTTEIIY